MAAKQADPPAVPIPNAKGAWKTVKPFVNGGASGMLATCIIQPIDMVKVRLQLGATGSPVRPRFQSVLLATHQSMSPATHRHSCCSLRGSPVWCQASMCSGKCSSPHGQQRQPVVPQSCRRAGDNTE
jgi:Mitochondrial carrier protein